MTTFPSSLLLNTDPKAQGIFTMASQKASPLRAFPTFKNATGETLDPGDIVEMFEVQQKAILLPGSTISCDLMTAATVKVGHSGWTTSQGVDVPANDAAFLGATSIASGLVEQKLALGGKPFLIEGKTRIIVTIDGAELGTDKEIWMDIATANVLT